MNLYVAFQRGKSFDGETAPRGTCVHVNFDFNSNIDLRMAD